MTLAETYSWIFYAIALASQTQPAARDAISTIADGINHAVPTQKEMDASISWLLSQGLVSREGKRFRLSLAGTELLQAVAPEKATAFQVWEQIELRFARRGVDDTKQINPRNLIAEEVAGGHGQT